MTEVRDTPERHEAEDALGGRTPAELLGAYFKALRRRRKLLVVITLLTVATAVALTFRATEQYDATAKILLRQSGALGALLDPGSSGGSRDSERDVNTNLQLIELETVADRARARLGLRMSSADILEKVTTEPQGNSNIVAITVRDSDRTLAAAIATALAEEYVLFRRQAARRSVDEAAQLARERLTSLTPEQQASPQGRQLESRLRELEIAAALQTGGADVVQRASVPTAAATPRPLITGAIAALVGFAAAVAVALSLELRDRRLKDVEEVESMLALPLLSTIPRARRTMIGARGSPLAEHEGYAMLATNLRFLQPGAQSKVLLFASPAAGEGKTRVTLGLARALTGLGARVIAIEGDLRVPKFSDYTGVDGGRGLTSILVGASDLDREAVEVDAATMTAVPRDTGRSGGASSFLVVPAGPLPPNPQALLSTRSMAAVIAESREKADIVLVDTAPILPVSDWLPLAQLADGLLLVLRLELTTRDAAQRAVRLIQGSGTDVLGAVLTNVPATFRQHYGDGQAFFPAGRRAATGRLDVVRRTFAGRWSKV